MAQYRSRPVVAAPRVRVTTRLAKLLRLLIAVVGLLATWMLYTTSQRTDAFRSAAQRQAQYDSNLRDAHLDAQHWTDAFAASEAPATAALRASREGSYIAPIAAYAPFQARDTENGKSCLEMWIARGELCAGIDFSQHRKIDGVWTWANGTEARHKAARALYWTDGSTPLKRALPDAATPQTAAAKVTRDAPQLLDDGLPEANDETTEVIVGTDDELEIIAERPLVPTAVGGVAPAEVEESEHKAWTRPVGEVLVEGYGNTASRFEDNNELLFSLRSAQAHLREHLGVMHILTPDFADDQWTPGSTRFTAEDGQQRSGQLPQWLNISTPGVVTGDAAQAVSLAPGTKLAVHHNWQSFTPLAASAQVVTRSSGADALVAWKNTHLPTFNSIAIEMMMAFQPSISEHFYYSNDDTYLGTDVSASDFFSPLHGPNLVLRRSETVGPWREAPLNLGYNAGLHFASAMLSDRFGTRNRTYVVHTQKVVSKPLLLETVGMFAEELEPSVRRFRATGHDTNVWFLLYHTIMERHREAMLWSFFTLRSDSNLDGVLDEEEVSSMTEDLGIRPEHWDADGEVPIEFPLRQAPFSGENFLHAGLAPPQAAVIRHTSANGYVGGSYEGVHSSSWPRFLRNKGAGRVACKLSQECIAAVRPGSSTEDVFKLFAFEKPACGDCAIIRLLAASSARGLEAFLPEEGEVFPSRSEGESSTKASTPRLPVTSDWRATDFSVASVMGRTGWHGLSQRTFAMRLLLRYQYSISGMSRIFGRVQDQTSAGALVEELSTSAVTLICINDEIADSDSGTRSETMAYIKRFYLSMWPQPLSFERTDSA